jgi:hypothetical protein
MSVANDLWPCGRETFQSRHRQYEMCMHHSCQTSYLPIIANNHSKIEYHGLVSDQDLVSISNEYHLNMS